MLFNNLKDRGLAYQVTDPILEKKLSEPLTFYTGFDPSADSLHIGSLLPIITMKRLQDGGHKPIVVLGGATGMIGDPSFKSQERVLLTENQIEKNIAGISKIFDKILDFSGSNKAIMVNNYDWMSQFSYVNFLRDVGKHFSVNMMIAKESIRSRLEDRDQGISYTEFSYMLLQAYDFYHLYKSHGCTLQLGGSDQWGNIVAGTELIRRMNAALNEQHSEVFGMTFPLITKSDGTKFGKTESGNVWLDPQKTSPYQFYQFFIQIADNDIMRIMKYFSFKPLSEIHEIESEFKKSPEKRLAQKTLAAEITDLIHGSVERQKIEQASQALFDGNLKNLSLTDLQNTFKEAPQTTISSSEFQQGISLIDLLVKTGLCSSKGAARKDIEGGGININNERITNTQLTLDKTHALHQKLIVLRKGKKNYHLVYIG